MNTKPLDRYDAAFGCLLGACVGDAAGATLEFLGRVPTLSEVGRAMSMPGGEPWRIAPGQVTDDGELTLCLAHALAQSRQFNVETNAGQYAAWIESLPFDRGLTLARAFSSVETPDWQTIFHATSYAEAMTHAAEQRSMSSKANGSLMRATPLGVWGYGYDDDELASYARQDSRLSHPNASCCDAVACYAIAIASLMRAFGERETAFDRAQYWAIHHGNAEVQEWMGAARQNVNEPYHPQAGFVKIAFIHAFRHLLLGTPYEEAIRETLSGGGDTDTNACIVGGLMGAAYGAEAIPDSMKIPVLSCDLQNGEHPRPEFLQARYLPEVTMRLLQAGGTL